MALKVGTLEVDITADTSGLAAAEREVAKTTGKAKEAFAGMGAAATAAGTKARDGFKGAGAAANNAAGGFNRMRFAAGQLGFQVQDVAVQLQSGTNAMRVFVQQGSQIASIFGPSGAIIGAVLAVGGAVVGALIPSLLESKDATEELEVALEGLDEVATRTAEGGVVILTERIVELARVSEDAARSEIRGGIIAALEAMEVAAVGASDAIEDTLPALAGFSGPIGMMEGMARGAAASLGLTVRELDQVRTAFAAFQQDANAETFQELQDILDRLAGEGASTAFVKLANDVREFSSSYTDATEKTAKLEAILKDLNTGLEETERLTAKTAKSTDRMGEAMRRAADRRLAQLATLGETELEAIARQETERREFILAQTHITADAQADLLEQVHEDRLSQEEALHERLREMEDRASEQSRRAAEQQARQQVAVRRQAVASLASLAGQAAEVAAAAGQEGTAIAKAIFLTQKAIQVASIIAATEVAAAQAAAAVSAGGPLAFFATAGAIRATGYASAALVAGLAVGGTVGGGRQFGGNVSPQMAHPINEGGVPEILNQGGRQFLLPTGQGGTISPMGDSKPGTGQANVTIISNGTPQTVDGVNVSLEEVTVMINDAAKRVEDGVTTSLATGRGGPARGLQRGFNVARNLR